MTKRKRMTKMMITVKRLAVPDGTTLLLLGLNTPLPD